MTAAYRKLVSDVGGVALGLEHALNQADSHAVPQLILAELPQLEALTAQLEQVECPVEARAANEALRAGLRRFQDDLIDVCDEATLAASQGDVFQRGLIFPSMAQTDGGGRMRWELSQSHGLAAVKQALSELTAAGFTDNGGSARPEPWAGQDSNLRPWD